LRRKGEVGLRLNLFYIEMKYFPKKMVDITNPMGYYIGKIWKKGGGQA